MNRKQFAAQKSAHESFPNIRDFAMRGLNATSETSKDAMFREIIAIGDKWINDFGDYDPAWKPNDSDIQPVAVPEGTPRGARAFARSLGSYQN